MTPRLRALTSVVALLALWLVAVAADAPTAGTLDATILGALVAAVLGGIKMIHPMVKKAVPNWAWPVVVLFLASVGTSTCRKFSLACAGNPLAWGPVEAQTLGIAFLAMIQRELAVGLVWLKAWMEQKVEGPLLQ